MTQYQINARDEHIARLDAKIVQLEALLKAKGIAVPKEETPFSFPTWRKVSQRNKPTKKKE